MEGEILMDKQVDKKIERIEKLKQKEIEKINKINKVIHEYDQELKVLNDLKKEQEKINKMQQDLNTKISTKILGKEEKHG